MKRDPKIPESAADTKFDVPMRGYLCQGLLKLLSWHPKEINDAVNETGADPAKVRNFLEVMRGAFHLQDKTYTIDAPTLAAVTRGSIKSLIAPRDDLADAVSIPDDVPIEERARILTEAASVVTLHEVFAGNKIHAKEFSKWLQCNIATLKNLQVAGLSAAHAKRAFRDRDTVRNFRNKRGRNDPCHCGSERKFKKCCGSQLSQEPESDSDAPRVVLEKEEDTP